MTAPDLAQGLPEPLGQDRRHRLLRVGPPAAVVQGNLLDDAKTFDVVRVQVREDQVLDAAHTPSIQEIDDLRRGIYEEVDVMQKGRWS